MPHLYSAFHQASCSGMPVQRSLVFQYPDDPKIYQEQYQNQFFFGDSIMVCPVASSERISKVYLPKGSWYNFYSDEFYDGGLELLIESPLEKLPIFVQAGAIIGMQSLLQSMHEQHDGVLRLHIYYSDQNHEAAIYNDDGTTYDFGRGAYSLRKINYSGESQSLKIEEIGDLNFSGFAKIQICLHGFSAFTKATIEKTDYALQASTIKLMENLPDFDPLGKDYQPLAELEVLSIIVENSMSIELSFS